MSAKSRIETMTLTPDEVKQAIRAMYNTVSKRAVFLWGPPGIAKSQVAQQVATEMSIAFIDIRLSQMDPTDLRGIPFPVVENGVHGIRWSPPLVLPRDINFSKVMTVEYAETAKLDFAGLNPTGANGIRYVKAPKVEIISLNNDPSVTVKIVAQDAVSVEFGLYDASGALVPGVARVNVTGDAEAIVGLEEFNSAPPSVLAASYELVLDRRLGEYRAPKGAYFMALGNRDTDKGVTFKMPTPVMNRFVHIEQRVHFEGWQAWGLNAGVHAEVIGYLTAFPNKLFQFEPGSAARGFATPRSWEFVSDILNANTYLPEMVMLALLTGAVGDAEGAQFMEFRKIAHKLPKPYDVLSGRLQKMPEKTEVSLAYTLATTLCYTLKERSQDLARQHTGAGDWRAKPEGTKWLQEADNFIAFLMNNFQPEINIMAARAAISQFRLPFDTRRMKNFNVFADKYKEMITG